MRVAIPIITGLIALACGGSPEESALVDAAASGDLEGIRAALAKGASPDAHANDDWTPLAVAAREGQLAAVELLIEQGAAIDHCEGGGNTPLFWAAFSGNLDVAQALLRHGADPTHSCSGQLPSAIARQRGHDAVAEVLDVTGR